MRKISLFYLLLISFSLRSQDSILVTKGFYFEDGLYSSFEELKNNSPTLLWDEVTATYFSNPDNLTAKVQELILKEENKALDPDSFFAVTIKGTPYIQLKGKSENIFAGLKVRGIISYFSYEETSVKKVKIQAFNPLNGKPFRSGFVDKKDTYLTEKMLLWETGEILDFNRKNFTVNIANDKPLQASVEELEDWEIEEKLFKCLLIYNDRHNVFTSRPK